jgi:hypothetical protein
LVLDGRDTYFYLGRSASWLMLERMLKCGVFVSISVELTCHITATIIIGHHCYTDTKSQSHFTADSQSVCLGVERTLWRCLGLKFVVLSLWGALSDERLGLSIVSHSLVIWLCAHLLFTFLFFTPLPPPPHTRTHAHAQIYTIQ